MAECVKKKGKFKFCLEIRIFDSHWPAGRYFVAHGVWGKLVAQKRASQEP